MFGPRMKNKSNASADDGRFTSNTCTSANEFLQGRRNTPPHKRQEEVVIRQRRGLGGQMEAFPACHKPKPQASAAFTMAHCTRRHHRHRQSQCCYVW